MILPDSLTRQREIFYVGGFYVFYDAIKSVIVLLCISLLKRNKKLYFADFDIFFIILEFLFDFLKLCDMLYESREVYFKNTFHLFENEMF